MKMIELDKTPLKKEDIYDIGGYKLVYGKNIDYKLIERQRLLGAVEGLKEDLKKDNLFEALYLVNKYFGVLK